LNSQQKSYYINLAAQLLREGRKAVSFDVFESLTVKPLWFGEDLFYAMDKEWHGKKPFHVYRIKAEKKARKKNVFGETTLSEIYMQFGELSGAAPEETERLMKRECELEVHFAMPRKCGMKLYRDAVEENKKIILTCDTYLPQETVNEILGKIGIEKYNALLISGKMKVNKDSGDFYPLLLKRMRLKPSQLFHVGDDLYSDVEVPVRMGVDAILLPTCRELLIKSGNLCGFIGGRLKDKFSDAEYVNLRNKLALYAVYAFDWPFSEKLSGSFGGSQANVDFLQGNEEFATLFSQYFEDFSSYGRKGFELPNEFFEKYLDAGDCKAFCPKRPICKPTVHEASVIGKQQKMPPPMPEVKGAQKVPLKLRLFWMLKKFRRR